LLTILFDPSVRIEENRNHGSMPAKTITG